MKRKKKKVSSVYPVEEEGLKIPPTYHPFCREPFGWSFWRSITINPNPRKKEIKKR